MSPSVAPWFRRLRLMTCLVLVSALVLTIVVRRFVVSGWLLGLPVVGDSMYPTLLSDHLVTDCLACGIRSRVSLLANDQPLRCPHCGSDDVQPRRTAGDRVVIEKWNMRQAIVRGAIVAFRDPDVDQIAIKRVVGLPGEKVAIRAGGVYCDGEQVAAEPRFLVNDDRYRRQGVSQWKSRDGHAWLACEEGFRLGQVASEHMHWLLFEPRPDAGDDVNVVYDDIGFNRGVSRRLHPVVDVCVEGVVSLRGRGEFALWLQSDVGASKKLIYDVGANVLRDHEDRQYGHYSDREFTFRVERGRQVSRFTLAGHPPIELPVEQAMDGGRFLIGARGLDVTVRDLVVRRAGFVTLDAPHLVEESHWNLASDEYFLLGDNAPVSRDSRHFSPIRRSQLLGIVRRH